MAEGVLDFDDDTLKAIAEVYIQEGIKEYKNQEWENALHFYTEGIKVSCKGDELNAKLYNNRATAHFQLGNYQETLNDANAAITLQPTFIKAIERGARACLELRLYEDALTWCDKGLAINKNSKALLDLRAKSEEEMKSQTVKSQVMNYRTNLVAVFASVIRSFSRSFGEHNCPNQLRRRQKGANSLILIKDCSYMFF